MTPEFVDSHAPFDGEVVTDAPWKKPPPFKWEPKPSLWSRFVWWLGRAFV